MDTPEKRHSRYMIQSTWTLHIRTHLLQILPIPPGRTLDVGCGTGAVTSTLPGEVYAIDINLEDLRFALDAAPGPSYLGGNAYKIPFPDNCFNLVCCHFLLLWLRDPLRALEDMKRVLKPGGTLVLFAEPDYGGRIDYPPPLEEAGRLQIEALRTQGSDPEIGRKLRWMLTHLGMTESHCGVLGGEWHSTGSTAAEIVSEWHTLTADLGSLVPAEDLERLLHADQKAWMGNTRILYVPTFYAWGRKSIPGD